MDEDSTKFYLWNKSERNPTSRSPWESEAEKNKKMALHPTILDLINGLSSKEHITGKPKKKYGGKAQAHASKYC